MRPEARERARQIDLKGMRIEVPGGFSALGFGFPDVAADPEVFADGAALRLSTNS